MDEDVEPRGSAAEYRRREMEMRAAAEAAKLGGQRTKLLVAAERWRQLAEMAEGRRATAFPPADTPTV